MSFYIWSVFDAFKEGIGVGGEWRERCVDVIGGILFGVLEVIVRILYLFKVKLLRVLSRGIIWFNLFKIKL